MSETAERLMVLAEAHIGNAGYGGFSFRELAAEIGIKSASVHHHFPTKATMAAALARRYGDRLLAAVARRPNESAGDAISVYRLAFRKALSRPRLTSGLVLTGGNDHLQACRLLKVDRWCARCPRQRVQN